MGRPTFYVNGPFVLMLVVRSMPQGLAHHLNFELMVNGMGYVGGARGYGLPLHHFYSVVCGGVGVAGLVAHHPLFYIYFFI